MDNYRYGLTSTLELLLLVGQYYFSSLIHFTLMILISIVCIMHTCQTDIRSESFNETFTLFLYSSWPVLILWFFYNDILKILYKCPVIRCIYITNYDCYDRGAVFSPPEREEQKKQLDLVFKSKVYFIQKRVNICYIHFADNLQKKSKKNKTSIWM